MVDVHITGCHIRNCGNVAVSLNGYNSSLQNCEISGSGGHAASVGGGDSTKLLPGFVTANNNTVHSYSRFKRTYQPGVCLQIAVESKSIVHHTRSLHFKQPTSPFGAPIVMWLQSNVFALFHAVCSATSPPSFPLQSGAFGQVDN